MVEGASPTGDRAGRASPQAPSGLDHPATIPCAHELAMTVYRFLRQCPRADVGVVLDGVNRGVLAALEREREYAAKADGAMMAALALASKHRLGPDLARTLSMRVGANLLPAKGRSALEQAFLASAIEAATAGETQSGSTEGESAVAKPDAQGPSA